METLKVWNLYEVQVDAEDGDDAVEYHVGTFASIERARQEVSDLHPGMTTSGALIQSGGVVLVDGGLGGKYVVRRMEVVS